MNTPIESASFCFTHETPDIHRQLAEEKLYYLKKKCQKRNRECSLTVEDLIESYATEFCPISGVALTDSIGHTRMLFNCRTIDRIDSSKGYVKGNILTVCYAVNHYKAKLETPDRDGNRLELNTILDKVRQRFGPKWQRDCPAGTRFCAPEMLDFPAFS